MYRALLIDDDARHAERLIARLQPRPLAIERLRKPEEAIAKLGRHTNGYQLVIVNVSDACYPWLRTLRRLQEVCCQLTGRSAPSFLCLSQSEKPPGFVLQIEHLGARYVFER